MTNVEQELAKVEEKKAKINEAFITKLREIETRSIAELKVRK